MTTHAKLSPSASQRWLNCNESVELNAGHDGGNFWADQGTAAHALLEMCQRIDVEPQTFIGTAMYKDHVVTEEMAEAVGHALDFIKSYVARYPHAKVHIEREVDPYKVVGCEKGHASGTPDVMIDNAVQLELIGIDYKHGVGSVAAEGNTQVLQYLGGYWAQFCTRPYKKYTGVIIQPRDRHADGPVRPHDYTHAEVLAHLQRIKKRVIEIRKHPNERKAGDWCKWCKAAPRCATLRARVQEIAQIEFKEAPKVKPGNVKLKDLFPKQAVDPKGLSNKELAETAKHLDMIEAWLHAVRGAMLVLLLQQGKPLPGWKLVKGRSTRSWDDDEKVLAMLLKQFKLRPDDVAPRKLQGIAKVEALMKQRFKGKKKDYKLPPVLAKRIKWSQPALHVARADDPRTEVKRGQEFVGK